MGYGYGYGYGFYGYYFQYLLFMLPAIILVLWAQWLVKSRYKKYSGITTSLRVTGKEMAERILKANGISNISVARISGQMTDNFNPKAGTIFLSDGVYDSTSIAAVGIAAHEAGHAVQYSKGYVPIKVRSVILPVCNLGSQLSMPLLIIGLIFDFYFLVKLGVIFFCVALLFQLLTLPIEFNASHRALVTLDSSGLIREDEQKAVRRVLSAAAMTYVAALLVSLTQLIRLLAITKRNRR